MKFSSNRIETREKNHIVKGKTELEVIEFLTHNRKIFGLLTEEIKKSILEKSKF